MPSFRKARRTAARRALYGSLVIAAAGGALLVPRPSPSIAAHEVDWAAVEWETVPEVVRFQRYLQIDTSPDGDEGAGARFLAEQLAAAGIPTQIQTVAPGRANLWAILEGKDPAALVLHSHLDVEPATEHLEAWLHPPFSGTIDPPWIFGRGAFDMKSVTMAQLEAITALAARGRPRRSVIFLATSSEESGSDLGTRWLLRERPELVERFWAVLDEGGVVEGRSLADLKYWGTEVGQKTFVDLTYCSDRREPLDELAAWTAAEGKPLYPLQVSPSLRSFLAGYAATRDHSELRAMLADPDALAADPRRFTRRDSSAAGEFLPPYLQALFRPELYNLGIHRVAGGWELRLKLLLLPGQELDDVLRALLPAWVTYGLAEHVEWRGEVAGTSPLDHPVFAAIGALLSETYPHAANGPFLLGSTATDASFFRAAGIPAYGFSPFYILTPDTLTLHHPNERIALPGFLQGVGLYRQLVERLAG